MIFLADSDDAFAVGMADSIGRTIRFRRSSDAIGNEGLQFVEAALGQIRAPLTPVNCRLRILCRSGVVGMAVITAVVRSNQPARDIILAERGRQLVYVECADCHPACHLVAQPR